MNDKNKPKGKNQPESQQEATQQPENDKPKNSKVNNINLLAFKRIKGNGEQPTTTYFLKACTNCSNKFVTENRESETCSDDCQSDNRIRGGGRHAVESNPADIANDFDLEEYPRRNETQTIAQLKKEAEQRMVDEIRKQQERERAEKQQQQREQEEKKRKAYERKLNAFLKNLPESLEEAITKALDYNASQQITESEYIVINAFEEGVFLIIAEDIEGNIIATFPFHSIKNNWIEKIKACINIESKETTREILESYELTLYCGEYEITINGFLQVKIHNEAGEPISVYNFLECNEAYHCLYG